MLKKSIFLRVCAMVMALLMLSGSLTGCKKAKTHKEMVTSAYDVWIEDSTIQEGSDTSSDFDFTPDWNIGSDDTSSNTDSQINNDFLGGGGGIGTVNKVSLEYTDYYLFSAKPTIRWSKLDNGQSVNITLKDAAGNVVINKKGLTGTSYKCETALKDGKSYTLFMSYNNPDGNVRVVNNVGENGRVFTCVAGTNNDGKNYKFDGSISFEVVNNYLARGLTYTGIGQDPTMAKHIDEGIRFIANIGAKYIQRAGGEWYPSNYIETNAEYVKAKLAAAHEMDPDIVFEAAIFECVNPAVNNIPIPSWVFEAFGLPVETRNFDVDKMYLSNGYGKDYWKESDHAHLPSICMPEFQMFVYYRAACFIDIGYEALHLGQVKLTGEYFADGKKDEKNENWTKVINMIRDYAKKNARRHYVLINAHNNEFRSPDGKMLVDYIIAPIRPKPADNQVDHPVSENNPQKCVLEPGYWGAPYLSGISGTSPSGWYAEKYPYIVEFDNYSVGNTDTSDKDSYVWGKDEISWYVVQPQWYRKEFMNYVLAKLEEFNDNGHVAFVGYRGNNFYSNNKNTLCPTGVGDESWIKEIFGK